MYKVGCAEPEGQRSLAFVPQRTILRVRTELAPGGNTHLCDSQGAVGIRSELAPSYPTVASHTFQR